MKKRQNSELSNKNTDLLFIKKNQEEEIHIFYMQRMFFTSRSFSSNSNSSLAESNIRLIVKFITLSCCSRFAKHQITESNAIG